MNTRALATLVIACAACGLSSSSAAQPLTTAVTYQGRLSDAGAPVSGTYDLRFTLFDASAAGTQIGAALCVDGVPVLAGQFTVSLDFGAAFEGSQRFLQVAVREDSTAGNCGVGAYTVLAPRQPFTAAPYALYALAAPMNPGDITGVLSGPGLTGGGTFGDVALAIADGGVTGVKLAAASVSADKVVFPFENSLALPGAAFALTNSGAGGAIAGHSTSSTVDAAGLRGTATSAAGQVYGVFGSTTSTDANAAGVFGSSSAGNAPGILGKTTSTEVGAAAIRGLALATVAENTGVDGTTLSSVDNSCGVLGVAGSAAQTGVTFGVLGITDSRTLNAAGVKGVATYSDAGGGATYGVFGETASLDGGAAGVQGECIHPTDDGGFGVFGRSRARAGGVGVGGSAEGNNGLQYGVSGQSDSTWTGSAGVIGESLNSSGVTYGVRGETFSESDGASGVYGEALATSFSTTYGVHGLASGTAYGAAGVKGEGLAPLGTTFGVHGVTPSRDSFAAGVYGQSQAANSMARGVFGESASTVGGVAVQGSAMGSTGANVGVRGETWSTEAGAIGVHGQTRNINNTTQFGVKGNIASTDAYAAGVGGFAVRGAANGVVGQTDSPDAATAGVWAVAGASTNVNYGAFGQSASTNEGAAGVAALGNGAAGPGAPQAAALVIANGAIRATGAIRPASSIVLAATGWTNFNSSNKIECVPYTQDHCHVIGAYKDAVIANNLIKPTSMLYLTVKGAPPAPGSSCYAQVLTTIPGSATIRVTVMGADCCTIPAYAGGVTVHYLIINP